ncbi:tetratricopeptide repeat protein [Roseospirillum parvum]|uniref:protein O-GlcNAc transferase n=1 Tax=Roseospirillum parvum TaxID=83401 RepID=A0A1G8BQ11_9PROT|nr:tetratricopeptide repeat protein [Roseospirillum parvum]SDH35282.1 Predicted O-linked N-acetylglucosamine transferase, SPINDLY family [Roseospirillum parvum]
MDTPPPDAADGPDLAARYAARAAQALEAGDPTQALFLAEAARDLDDGRLPPWLISASACRLLGRLEEAAEHLERAVALAPEQPGVRAMAGLMAHRLGRPAVARPHLERALALDPRQGAVRSALALILAAADQPRAADDLLAEGLGLSPDDPDLLCNLATLRAGQGDPAAARTLLERALAAAPGHVEVLVNLGLRLLDDAPDVAARERGARLLEEAATLAPNRPEVLGAWATALRRLGRAEAAVAVLGRAVEMAPDDPGARNNLALARLDAGQAEAAEADLRHALTLAGARGEAGTLIASNLGMLLCRLGRLQESIAWLRALLKTAPDCLDGAINLGNALLQDGQLAAAEDLFQELAERHPEHPTPRLGLANLAWEGHRYGAAVRHGRAARRLAPDNPNILNSLGVTLKDMGSPAEAFALCRRAVALCPVPADRQDYLSNALYSWQYRADASAATVAAVHGAAAPVFESGRPDPARPHLNSPDPERRLRVGYFSADFRAHAVAFFLQGVLAGHRAEQVEVFAYSATVKPDAITARLKADCDHWREVTGLGPRALADLAVADGLDIAVDLAGHTAGNLLPALALRPAPLVLSWIGYPGTTGLQAVDYRLSDARADPPDDPWPGSEKVLRLPDCFHLYTPEADLPPVAPAPCRTRRAVTFCSFNNLAKVTDQVIAAWGRILAALPEARLLIKCKQFKDPELVAATVDRLVAAGAGAGQVEPVTYAANLDAHLAIYGFADLGLDTFPYNGTTTTCEAMWMGVPVLSLAGDRHAGRVGASLLEAVGLADHLLADDVDDYVARAIALGRDLERLAGWRDTLRQRFAASPLCDRARFVEHLEAAYRHIWGDWCARVAAHGPTHQWLPPDLLAQPAWPDTAEGGA